MSVNVADSLSVSYPDPCTPDDPMLSAPKIPHFPQELIDLVIDSLKDDSATLRVCALVNRTWLPRCRMYLHHTMKLLCSDHCTNAIAVFKDPTLARYVRELEIHGERYGRWRAHGGAVMDDHESSWVDEGITSLISELPDMTYLDSVFLHDAQDVFWGNRPLFATVTKLSLLRVEYQTPDQFTKFLGHFPQLRILCIEDLTFRRKEGRIMAPGARPALHTLEIKSSPCQEFVLNWFLYQPPNDIQLKRLSYTVDRWHVRAPSSSVQALGSSVEDLTILFTYESPHYLLKGDPLLSHFTSLRALSFDHATIYGTLYGPPSIPVLLRLVSSRNLRFIGFRFSLDARFTSHVDCLEKVGRIRLAETDRFLNSLQAFANVAEVTVQIRSPEWAKLTRLRTSAEWVRAELDDTAVKVGKGKTVMRKRCCRFDNGEGHPHELDPDWPKDMDYERALIQRAQTDFEKTVQTWQEAEQAFRRELREVADHKILKIEPIDHERPLNTVDFYAPPHNLPRSWHFGLYHGL